MHFTQGASSGNEDGRSRVSRTPFSPGMAFVRRLSHTHTAVLQTQGPYGPSYQPGMQVAPVPMMMPPGGVCVCIRKRATPDNPPHTQQHTRHTGFQRSSSHSRSWHALQRIPSTTSPELLICLTSSHPHPHPTPPHSPFDSFTIPILPFFYAVVSPPPFFHFLHWQRTDDYWKGKP